MALVLLLTLLSGRIVAMILFILVLNVTRSSPAIPVFFGVLLIVHIMNKYLPLAIPSCEVRRS